MPVSHTRVLLMNFARRAASLRAYAGDTALPGGKVDEGDRTLEDTAVSLQNLLLRSILSTFLQRREAFEEARLIAPYRFPSCL